ncbi:isocitrate lyase/phosphoenolpyruvate mutase family protein [Massilia sp. SR12]
MATRAEHIAALQTDWECNPRWQGVARAYSAAEVVRLRGSLQVEHTLARRGAERLWELLRQQPFVGALGALNGHQAVQQVMAGLRALYVSAAEDSGPMAVRSVNTILLRADQIQWSEGREDFDFVAPLVADGEAGCGGALDAFEQMKAMIGAGAAGVHFGDQRPSGAHGGHPGARVLLPTREAIGMLVAARLAADVMGTPTLVIARTDAEAADLLATDIDDNDRPFCTGGRTVEGYYQVRNGLEQAIARALAYAPYADLLWCETSRPDLAFAKALAEAVHEQFPGKMLAYNCSPSFNWKKHLDDASIARFQKELGAMGYKLQLVPQAGSHSQDYGMFKLAHGYARRQMPAFVELQEAEFAAAEQGFAALKQQRAVDADYFDAVRQAIAAREAPLIEPKKVA